MLKEKRNFLKSLNSFLFMFNIFLLFVFVYTKYFMYKKKINIRYIDKKIVKTINEDRNYQIELTYLTNPERLKKIYEFLKINKIGDFDKGRIINSYEIKTFDQLKTENIF